MKMFPFFPHTSLFFSFFQNTPGTSAALASGNSPGNRLLYHLLVSADASARLTETQTKTRSGRTPAERSSVKGEDEGEENPPAATSASPK